MPPTWKNSLTEAELNRPHRLTIELAGNFVMVTPRL